MTTTTSPRLPSATRSVPPGWIIVGAVIIVSGFLTAISGGALLALFGSDRVLNSGEHRVSTPTTALVADLGRITDVDGFQYVMGSPTLHVTAENDAEGPIFIGIGRADEVDRYLAGVSTDRVTDLETVPVRTEHRPPRRVGYPRCTGGAEHLGGVVDVQRCRTVLGDPRRPLRGGHDERRRFRRTCRPRPGSGSACRIRRRSGRWSSVPAW